MKCGKYHHPTRTKPGKPLNITNPKEWSEIHRRAELNMSLEKRNIRSNKLSIKRKSFIANHPEEIERLCKLLASQARSETRRKKIGIYKREQWKDSSYASHMVGMLGVVWQSKRGVPLSTERKEECRKARIEYLKSHPQAINAISMAKKKNWQDDRYARRIIQAWRNSPNKAEKKLIGLLDEVYPNEWEYVGNGKFLLGGKCPDFLYGYSCLVIWEHELEDIVGLKRKLVEGLSKPQTSMVKKEVVAL